MQVTPSLLMTASLVFSTRRHTAYTQMCMEFNAHHCAYAFYREKKALNVSYHCKKIKKQKEGAEEKDRKRGRSQGLMVILLS